MASQNCIILVYPPPAPCSYIGWGWYSDDSKWDDVRCCDRGWGSGHSLLAHQAALCLQLFLLDVGEPTGLCTEAPPGVFSRNWSLGVASLDCNTWQASLPFGSLQPQQRY